MAGWAESPPRPTPAISPGGWRSHGGMRGQASDIQIEAEQIIRMRDRVNRMISEETGQPIDKIVKDTQRNFWMNAEEAKAYGIVSKIIHRADEA